MAQAEGVTALLSTDWSALVDAADDGGGRRVEELEDGHIAAAIMQMTSSGGMQGIDPTWLDFLRHDMQVTAFMAEGARRALERAADRCPEEDVRHCLELQALMCERQAQSVVLYAMDLSRQLGAMPIDVSRDAWTHRAAWAPARAMLTAIARRDDWTAIVCGLNLCFEPIAGLLLRREFAARAAVAAADTVTPVVAAAGQIDWGWVRRWTTGLIAGLVEDPVHGEENRVVVARRVATDTPVAAAAAAAITTVGDGTPWAPALRDGLRRVLSDQTSLLIEAGLQPVTTTTRES